MDVWHAIQVLRRQGQSKKAIARQLGVSRNMVKRYLRRNDPPDYQRKPAAKLLDQHADQIKGMMAQGFIGTRIFPEPALPGYQGSLTSVYRCLRQLRERWEAAEKTAIHFETPPGRQMQYDWKQWLVPVKGQPLKVCFHQAILSFSRYKFVTFSLDVSTPTIIRVLMQAPAAFQGVPEEIIIDNPKQLLLSHDRRGTIRYQDDFSAFLGAYGLKPDPCRPYRARTKGKVENPFYYLQEHFLRGLAVEEAGGIEARSAPFMEQDNARSHSTTGRHRCSSGPRKTCGPYP